MGFDCVKAAIVSSVLRPPRDVCCDEITVGGFDNAGQPTVPLRELSS